MIEECAEVSPHIGISVLLNDERRRGVLEVKGGEPGLQPAFRDELLDALGELVKATATRGNLKVVNALTQHSRASTELLDRGRLLLPNHALDFLVARVTSGESLLIVPLREFLEGRLPGRVNHRQRKVRFAPTRPEADRVAQGGFSLGAHSLLDQSLTQKVLRARVVR